MIVAPYKRRPERPRVCYLNPDGIVLDEAGDRVAWRTWPERARCWTSFDTARSLVLDGAGESLCWRGEEIRYRHERRDDGDTWRHRPTDAHVLRLDLCGVDDELVLAALARWRTWLARHGAAPIGTVASCAWSLLRATLPWTLYTPTPAQGVPGVEFTIGGRQSLGAAGAGTYIGRLEHVDMSAAYARTLAELPYGGRWTELPQPPTWRRLEQARGSERRAVFVRARVRVPELSLGPLPDRPRDAGHPFLRLGIGPEYPVGCQLTRTWTLEELEAARDAGCRVKLDRAWCHFAGGRRPFAPWWEAVEQGRRMRGLAGVLAKQTGNALWGRFALSSPRYGGGRTIKSRHGRATLSRPLTCQEPLTAHDLAETVSGRVRAELYRVTSSWGDELLSMHTDGGWRFNASGAAAPEGWRVKDRGVRLDLLNPQTLRYWPAAGEPRCVVAGEPSLYAPAEFERRWAERAA